MSPPGPPPAPSDRSGWLGPLRVVAIAVAGVVVLAAVTGLVGGFERVPLEPVRAVPVGEQDRGLPWHVTVLSAELHPELPTGELTDENNHWLLVVAVVENSTRETRFDLSEVLYVTGIDGLDHPEAQPGWLEEYIAVNDVRLARDGSLFTGGQPGLAEELWFVWERASDAPPPAAVEVILVGKTHREDVLTGYQRWMDARPRARVVVPLQDLREPQDLEEESPDPEEGP